MKIVLKVPAVLLALGIGKTKLYELIELGLFPPGMHLFGRSIGWFDSEIEQYQEAIAAEADEAQLYALCSRIQSERTKQSPKMLHTA